MIKLGKETDDRAYVDWLGFPVSCPCADPATVMKVAGYTVLKLARKPDIGALMDTPFLIAVLLCPRCGSARLEAPAELPEDYH